jgi:RNA polymerase sigma-70 factor, ECF subfamily
MKRLTFVDQGTLETEPSADASPAELLARHDDRITLLRLVDGLPPRQQEVIQLRFQNDLSYREIADITGMTESNVGVALHAALKALRERRTMLPR